jgi:hypothetical protein
VLYPLRLFQNFSFWNSFLPWRKLHESQMLALQEIGNFLQELVSKPTGFWNKFHYFTIYFYILYLYIPKKFLGGMAHNVQ